jgi:hypothetical protein
VAAIGVHIGSTAKPSMHHVMALLCNSTGTHQPIFIQQTKIGCIKEQQQSNPLKTTSLFSLIGSFGPGCQLPGDPIVWKKGATRVDGKPVPYKAVYLLNVFFLTATGNALQRASLTFWPVGRVLGQELPPLTQDRPWLPLSHQPLSHFLPK